MCELGCGISLSASKSVIFCKISGSLTDIVFFAFVPSISSLVTFSVKIVIASLTGSTASATVRFVFASICPLKVSKSCFVAIFAMIMATAVIAKRDMHILRQGCGLILPTA